MAKQAKRKTSAKPGQPPSGADFSALTTKVNELATKVGVAKLNSTITGKIPAWKRWVGGEGPDYDAKGLRDVVNTNALFTDQIKGDVDTQAQAILELRADVQALKEAPAARPFP
jgi:hypothetical protein